MLKLIQPLPKDPAEINRLATLCPSPKDVPLLPGQKWMIFDTGARCSAMKVSCDCPQYAPFVKATQMIRAVRALKPPEAAPYRRGAKSTLICSSMTLATSCPFAT